ncbi:DUF559 domain-containing protein [Candidatus Peregrinibacteria bacterium]|nr:DUF559 domain-containing protein [Candidatus Peregrinibacteria bacterium]
MKLLFTRFPLESALGGAEIQTISLMRGLTKKGHAIAFAGSCPMLLQFAQKEGIPNVELRIGAPPVSEWHVLTFLWRKQRMQRSLESMLEQFHDIDAVFMLSLSEKILLTPLALQKGLKVFWIEHDRMGPWLSNNPWLSRLRDMSNYVTIVVVSDLSKKIYEDLGFKHVIAIPNGIDLDRFALPPRGTPIPRPLPELEPLSPDPFPRGEKGSSQAEKEFFPKPATNPYILGFARNMRKNPALAEKMLWEELRFEKLGVNFRRQHPVHNTILDFYCHEARLGIELDGGIHHGKYQSLSDAERDSFLSELGIHVLRFKNEEVLDTLSSVVEKIRKHLTKQTNNSLPPSGEGLGIGDHMGGELEIAEPQGIHIGCVARLTEDKGVDLLIQAVKDIPEVDLTILGSGREEGYLSTMIGNDDHIRIIRHLDDLGAFYRSLDALILPSREHDPFGLVAAEAMSLGIPVLVTDATGIASSLHDGTDAIVVHANDLTALKQGIRRLLNPEVREAIGRGGKETATEKFSLPTMIDRYEKLLHS